MLVRVLLVCLALLPQPALAHPHIFVDTTHRLIFDDQGRLTAVRVTWDYDELYSFTMLLESDYDTDGDGHLTGAELDAFQLWDAGWVEGYEGDIELFVGGQKVGLLPPTDWAADWHDGRAVSIHTRALTEPVEIGEGLVLRAFEPEFFVAYAIPEPPTYEGRDDCNGVVIHPDPDAVPPELMDQLAALDLDDRNQLADTIDLAQFYADEVRVSCGR